ncbi:MAG TPA: c-type cytochrome [Longimicrobiaceae bacterium]|nr:c-type cytochrome [Longimicrobiaceae bacterium]
MRKWLKRIGLGLGGLAVLALVAAAALYAVGRSRLERTYEAPPARLAMIPDDPASVERGRLIATSRGCLECHGERLGGEVFLDIPPGKIVAPNLTRGRGGVAGRYADADWDRAVRYGIRPDGHPILPFMPFRLYNRLSDADAAALIAYLKQLPPVDNELPATEVRVPGYLMVAMMGDDLRGGVDGAPRRATPPPGPTAEYGAYFASTVCVECHGEDLRGGEHPAPDGPPGPSLEAAGTWTYEQFATAMRTGRAPARTLSEWMPTKYFAELTDTELRALHAYTKTLSQAPREIQAASN